MRTRTFTAIMAYLLLAATIAAQSSLESTREQARRMVANREFEAAFVLLEGYVEDHPAQAGAWRELGNTYLAAGRWDDAIGTLKKATAMQPDDATFHLALAAAYREKAQRAGTFSAIKNAKRWKAELERSVELDPENVEARNWLVGYLVNAPGIGGGDKDRALALARGTIRIDEFEGRLSAGFAHRVRKEFEASIAEYETLLTVHSDSALVYAGYGYTLLAAKRADEAQSYFEHWASLAARTPQPQTGIGESYRARGKYDEAAAAFRKALKFDRYFSDARFALAEILEEQKQYAAAREEYRAVVELTPEHLMAAKAKKRAYRLKKKH